MTTFLRTNSPVEVLGSFDVVEFRRYTTTPGENHNFATYFESYFPSAFEQLGSVIFGHFVERGSSQGFTWIRGFHNMPERESVNRAFYGGPLWKQHAATMNGRLVDHTNVLLLTPLAPENGIPVLPALDPIAEPDGAQGLVVAQIFAPSPGGAGAFAELAATAFSAYREAGVREAGVLVTLDVENNFPPLPFRTDGPYLVWLGIVSGDAMFEKILRPLAGAEAHRLFASGLLRSSAELVVLDPARHSRLRWQ